MQHILQRNKGLIGLFLSTLLLVTSFLTIAPAQARADVTPTSSECITVDKEMPAPGKAPDKNIFKMEDLEAIAAIAGGASAAGSLGSVTVLTYTTAAHGLMALLVGGTTTVVAVPVAGVVAAGGILTYGGYKVYEYMQNQKNQATGIACPKENPEQKNPS